MYYSPSFGGLTFGVSFTPTGGQRRAGGGLSYGTDVTAPGPGNAGNNILSVGVDYVHDFGGWNLTAGGGGEWAFTQYTPAGGNTNNKPSWYQAGLQVGFGHFAIGASGAYYVNYQHAGYASTTATSGDDGWVVSGGASYTLDAWSFGLQGEYGQYQQSASRSGTINFDTRRTTRSCGAFRSTPPMPSGRASRSKVRLPIPMRTTAIFPASASPHPRGPSKASPPTVSIPGKSIWVPRSTSDRRENDDDFGGAVRRSPFSFEERVSSRSGASRLISAASLQSSHSRASPQFRYRPRA